MLDASDFPTFFSEVHRRSSDDEVLPFGWQQQLCAQVLDERRWPTALDVPTGLGKTAVLDIALFTLAVDTEANGHDRDLPLRVFLCVDRRLLVDQAHDRARRLASALADPGAERPVVARVAAALAQLRATGADYAGIGDVVAIAGLRGGTSWRSQWLNRPDVPALVSATVDQLGSRLLFRGYGVSDRRKPVDAALVGTDSLILLDEAHLARPFVETLGAAGRYEERLSGRPVGRRSTVVSLSATLREGGDRTFVFDEAGESSVRAQQRYRAEKPTRLVDLPGAKANDKGLALLAATLIEAALAATRAGALAVGVVVNRVDLARQVFDRLMRDHAAQISGALVIGRCRQWERDRLIAPVLESIRSGSRDPVTGMYHLERPTVFVATQTIEVGADLDFDALVSEAVPLDALAQRLGRLDRLGESAGPASAVVVHADAFHAEHPLYGRAAQRTWEWLCQQAGGYASVSKASDLPSVMVAAPTLDLGPARLRGLCGPEARQDLSAAPPATPVLVADHLDRWSHTSPIPDPDQAVAPFLHGVGRPAGTVSVAWRAGLPRTKEAWDAELAQAPLRPPEQVEVPIGAVRRFLGGLAPVGGSDVDAGVDDEGPDDEGDPFDERQLPTAFASGTGPDGDVTRIVARELRPGMVVLLHAEDGGHDDWGWSGQNDGDVADVADLILSDAPEGRLRLRPKVLGLGPDADDELARDLSRLSPSDAPVEEGMVEPDIGQILGRLARLLEGIEGPAAEGRRNLLGDALAHVGRIVVPAHADPDVGSCLRWPRGPSASVPVAEAIDDDTSSFTSRAVELEVHLRGVAARAEVFGRAAGLDPPLIAAAELAARAHDLGKADQRFQVMLYGGNALVAAADGRVLAKSGTDPAGWRAARDAARWPPGLRHEAISGALVRELVLLDGVDRELVEHLVTTHHGHGRPLFPSLVDAGSGPVVADMPLPDGTAVRLTARSDALGMGWDQPSRLHRLSRRYGWWGLALLESVVRLADITCSEEGG